jgi:hypothetical protein
VAQLPTFDCRALIEALDAQRAERELGWTPLAHELWQQSYDLNVELGDDALCPGALVRIVQRDWMTCQYALIILRWVRRAPEEFLTGPVVDVGGTTLPQPGPQWRLRWDLGEVHALLNQRRQDEGLTWTALADVIGCTPSRLTNLRTARLADMNLAMRVTQWMGQPAAKFIHPARW